MNVTKEKKEQTTIRLPADLKEELMKILGKLKDEQTISRLHS